MSVLIKSLNGIHDETVVKVQECVYENKHILRVYMTKGMENFCLEQCFPKDLMTLYL